MESLSMVSHTNALIKNRETIDINLYEQFIKYLDASPKHYGRCKGGKTV